MKTQDGRAPDVSPLTPDKVGVDRRSLLRALGQGAVGSGALVAGLPVQEAHAAESPDDRKKKRYRESEHVKAYYRTNRY